MLNFQIPPLVVLKISCCFLSLRWWFILWNRLLIWSLSVCGVSTDGSCWKIKDSFWVCIYWWPLIWLESKLLLHARVLLSVVLPVDNISGLSGTPAIKIIHQRLLGHQCRLGSLSSVLTKLFSWEPIRLTYHECSICSHRPLLSTSLRWVNFTAYALLAMCLANRSGAKSLNRWRRHKIFIVICACHLLLLFLIRQTPLMQLSQVSIGLCIR